MLSWGALAAGRAATATEGERLLPPRGTGGIVYVALGDSTVAGIGASSPDRNYPSLIAAKLREVYPEVTLRNLGVAGAVASDVVAQQLERAVAARPTLVTLSVGPNDVTMGVGATEYATSIDAILRALRDRTSAVIVVNLLPDLALTPRFAASPRRDVVGRRATELNDSLAASARRWGAAVIDLHAHSRTDVPTRPELVGTDGYHPSDAGYARWAELMWDGVARRLPRGNAAPTG